MNEQQPCASLAFRQAQPQDAIALAPLVLESGQHEFEFLLQGTVTERIDFLQKQISRPYGYFSWKRHWVAMSGKQIVAVLALQHHQPVNWDDVLFAHAVIAFYGYRKGAGILYRGVQLQRELPHPASQQILVVHCATHHDWRSKGVFSTFFHHIIRLPESGIGTQTLVLDVLNSNQHAAHLYQRLGFVQGQLSPDRTHNIPPTLFSTRLLKYAT